MNCNLQECKLQIEHPVEYSSLNGNTVQQSKYISIRLYRETSGALHNIPYRGAYRECRGAPENSHHDVY